MIQIVCIPITTIIMQITWYTRNWKFLQDSHAKVIKFSLNGEEERRDFMDEMKNLLLHILSLETIIIELAILSINEFIQAL